MYEGVIFPKEVKNNNDLVLAYMPIVLYLAKQYGGDFEELVSVGTLALVEGVKYSENLDHPNIVGYLTVRIKSAMLRFLHRNKVVPTPERVEPVTVTTINEDVEDKYQTDFEIMDELNKYIETELERQIVDLRLEGYKDDKIGELLGLTRKQVFLARQRLKRRFKRGQLV